MTESPDDDGAVAAVLAGDVDAFASLVAAHRERTFRAAYLIVRDAGLAEDLTQDAFLRAYRALHRFRRGEPFGAWVARIAINLALNETRSRRRRERWLSLVPGINRASSTVEREVEEAEQRSSIQRALAELAERDRLVIYLRYYLEFSEQEMATALGVPAGTVKSRLHRGTARLRTLIHERFPELEASHD